MDHSSYRNVMRLRMWSTLLVRFAEEDSKVPKAYVVRGLEEFVRFLHRDVTDLDNVVPRPPLPGNAQELWKRFLEEARRFQAGTREDRARRFQAGTREDRVLLMDAGELVEVLCLMEQALGGLAALVDQVDPDMLAPVQLRIAFLGMKWIHEYPETDEQDGFRERAYCLDALDGYFEKVLVPQLRQGAQADAGVDAGDPDDMEEWEFFYWLQVHMNKAEELLNAERIDPVKMKNALRDAYRELPNLVQFLNGFSEVASTYFAGTQTAPETAENAVGRPRSRLVVLKVIASFLAETLPELSLPGDLNDTFQQAIDYLDLDAAAAGNIDPAQILEQDFGLHQADQEAQRFIKALIPKVLQLYRKLAAEVGADASICLRAVKDVRIVAQEIKAELDTSRENLSHIRRMKSDIRDDEVVLGYLSLLKDLSIYLHGTTNEIAQIMEKQDVQEAVKVYQIFRHFTQAAYGRFQELFDLAMPPDLMGLAMGDFESNTPIV